MTRARLGWLLVVVQFVLLIALVLAPHRAATALSLAIGLALGVVGAALAASAARALRGALTPTPVPMAGAELRTDGPYRFMRHPIYTAVLLLGAGFTVAIGSWWTLGVLVVLVVFFVAKSRWEDRLLHERHGEQWDEWASRTGALVPRRRASNGR